jgi:hypothetical protein
LSLSSYCFTTLAVVKLYAAKLTADTHARSDPESGKLP